MSPSDFRSKKLATPFAYGGPRSSCVRPVFVLRSATHSDRGYHTDFTPCRRPPILSLPALTPQTPTKPAALRLRGGRRTPLVRSRSLASCTPSRSHPLLFKSSTRFDQRLLSNCHQSLGTSIYRFSETRSKSRS